MKLLSLICTICLSASWAVAQQNRFLEIPREGDTLTYDLDSVQITSPGKFTIIETIIDNPDVMKFELNALKILRNYCPRPDGNYPAPTELLQLGPPDLPVEQIEVAEHGPSRKLVSWKYPYRRMSVVTKLALQCKAEGRTGDDLFSEHHNLIANGLRTKEIFDCKRGLSGLFDDEHDDPSKVIISPVVPGSNGEENYLAICPAVMRQEPYLPPSE
jgi:hypothetical protein